jgi:dTDP-4-dehydrorhamnose reductase
MAIRLMAPDALVIGSGQLAQALAERAAPLGLALAFARRPQIDLTDPDSISRAVASSQAGVIVNAAAYTAVDRAETEPCLAEKVNAVAPGLIAAAAREKGARLIHVSTDYVFDGHSIEPYDETAATNPLGVYGRTKLEGEQAVRRARADHAIVRTAWVYSPFGRNFVATMLALAKDRTTVRVVDDQVGTPTSALDLADGLLAVILRWRTNPRADTAGRGETSWAGLAATAFSLSAALGGPFAKVEPIASSQWPTAAERPRNSRLDSSRFEAAFGYRIPHWRESLPDTVSRLVMARVGDER